MRDGRLVCTRERVRADAWALLLTQAAFPFLKVNNLGPAAGPAAPLFQHLMPAPSSQQLSSTTRTSAGRAQATLKKRPAPVQKWIDLHAFQNL